MSLYCHLYFRYWRLFTDTRQTLTLCRADLDAEHSEILTHPLRVLEGPDEQVYEPGDAAVLPERGVVGRAQGQVADEADDGLDQGPPENDSEIFKWHLSIFVIWQASMGSSHGVERQAHNRKDMRFESR